MMESCSEVIGGGLAALRIERTGLKENVGAGTVEPIRNVGQDFEMSPLRPVTVEQSQRIQAVGIGDPACAARSNSSEAPANIVAAAQFRLFRDEETKQRAANIAETDDGEVVERNGDLVLAGLLSDSGVEFLRDGQNVPSFSLEHAGSDNNLRVHVFPLFLFDGFAYGR